MTREPDRSDPHPVSEEDAVPLDGLPRTLDPPPAVEERLVGALRAEGLLGRPARPRPHGGWLAAALAAGIALFVGGLAVGQSIGGRATLETVMAVRGTDAGEHAAHLQRTGTLYVEAMTALDGEMAPSDEGREVALATLRAALFELARLYPEDVRVAALLSLLEADPGDDPDPTRSVLWF